MRGAIVVFGVCCAMAAFAQPMQQKRDCLKGKLRERAFCLSKIEDESAIPELLDVAKQMAKEKYVSQEDIRYAAENAGLVGAKTKTDKLVAMVKTGDSATQRFGVIALTHALSILRMGYAHGGERDKDHRAKIVVATSDVCAERLAATSDQVYDVAARCIAESGEKRHVPAIVKFTLAHDNKSALAIAGVRAIAELGTDLQTVRPLVRVLETPMPDKWLSDDVSIRSEVCALIGRYASAADRWAHLPAKTAAERIGDKSSQAKEPCDKLAAKTSGSQVATSTKKSTKNYFPTYPLERCRNDRFGILGSASLCVYSNPVKDNDKARTFEMILADTSKLDPSDNTKHLAILSVKIAAGPSEYVQYELVASYELTDGFWLVVVPIVEGVPDEYTAKKNQLYLIDTAKKKWTLAQTTKPCRAAGCAQEVQLRYKKDQLPMNILVEGDVKEQLSWDGRALKR